MSASLNKYISLDTLVSKLATNYGVTEDGWRGDLDSWVLGCFRNINNEAFFPLVYETVPIVDYKAKLPCSFEALHSVFNGSRVMNFLRFDPSPTQERPYSDYQFNIKGCYVEYPYVKFGIETGEVTIHYYTTYNIDGQLTIPVIEPLLDYIMITVIKYLTLRGYVHPLLNFQTLLTMERELMLRAVNACRTFTPEEYYQNYSRVTNVASTGL